MPVAQDTQSANASSGQQQQGGGSDALADPLSDPLAEGPKFKLPERIGNEHIYIAEKEKLPTALNQLEDGQSSASVASLVAPSFGEGEIATTFTRVGDDLQFTGTGTMNQTKDVSLGDVTLKSGGAYQVDVVGSRITKVSGDFTLDLGGMAEGHGIGELDVEGRKFQGMAELKQVGQLGNESVYLENGEISANITDNTLTEAGLKGDLVVPSVGTGSVDGSLAQSGDSYAFSGEGSLTQGPDLELGALTISDGSFTGTVTENNLTKIEGGAMGSLADTLTGMLTGEYAVEEEQFSGTADIEQSGDLGNEVVEVTDAKAQAQIEANALAQASAEATITIMQFAQGAFSGQMVADGDSYNLSGNASVDQLQDLEVGPVTAKDGHFDATLENGTVTEVAGSGSLIFGETFQGDASASFDPSDSTLTGVAQLSQLAPIGGDALQLTDAALAGALEKNVLTEMTGEGKVLISDFGEGSFSGSVDMSAEEPEVTGSASVTQTGEIGNEIVEVTDASGEAQVEANALTQVQAQATITIMQFAQGAFSGQMVADGDNYNLSGNASVDQLQDLEVGPVTAKDGHFDAALENGAVTEVAGSGVMTFGETFQGEFDGSYDPPDSSISGVAMLSQLTPIGGDTLQLTEADVMGTVEKSVVTKIEGEGKVNVSGFGEGSFSGSLDPTTEPMQVSGSVEVTQAEDVDIAGVARLHSSSFTGTLENNVLTGATGQGTVTVEGIGDGTFQGEVENPTTEPVFSGTANVEVSDGFDLGAAVNVKSASLGVSIVENKLDKATGSAEIELPALMAEGTLSDITYDFEKKTLSGTGTLNTTSPLSAGNFELTTAEVTAHMKDNVLEKVEVLATVKVGDSYQGDLMGEYDATSELVSGTAELNQLAPQTFLSVITIEGSTLSVDVQDSVLKKATGSGKITIAEKVSGELTSAEYDFEKEEISGTATVGLLTPIESGPVSLSEGSATAVLAANQVQSVSGDFKVEIDGFGEGAASGEWSQEKDTFSGSAEVTQTEAMEFGPISVEDCKISAQVVDNSISEAGVAGAVVLSGVGRGSIDGTFAVQEKEFSGTVKLDQIDASFFSFLEVSDGSLEGTLEKNQLTSGHGELTVSMPTIGKGVTAIIDANFENTGGGDPVVWGTGIAEFQPHERVKGMLEINLSKEQEVSGEGEVEIGITDTITGRGHAVVDKDGNTKLDGEIKFADQYTLVKGTENKHTVKPPAIEWSPWGFSFMGARIGILFGIRFEAGVAYGFDGLVLSDIFARGEVDLSQPELGSLELGGTLSAEAYAKAFATLKLYAALGLGVASVEGGAYATAAAEITPKLQLDALLGVSKDGVTFDSDFSATIAAKLAFELGFYAEANVVFWGTVWEKKYPGWKYEHELGELGIAGKMHAGSDGFSMDFEPVLPDDLASGEFDESGVRDDVDKM